MATCEKPIVARDSFLRGSSIFSEKVAKSTTSTSKNAKTNVSPQPPWKRTESDSMAPTPRLRRLRRSIRLGDIRRRLGLHRDQRALTASFSASSPRASGPEVVFCFFPARRSLVSGKQTHFFAEMELSGMKLLEKPCF